jgi:hypothetical protein
MSKLSERIRRAARTVPAPFGFGAAMAPAKSLSMLIVVRLAANESGKAAEAAKAGADVVIVAGDPAKLKADGAILGAALERTDRNAATAARGADVDFLLLDPATALAEAMLDQKLGYVLQLNEPLDDTRTRLLGDLNLDAIIVPSPKAPVTLAQLLELRRVAGLARTPLLVQADAGIDASLLQVLRDSGAAGIVVDASAIGNLGELKERIAGLPAAGRRPEERAEVTVSANAAAGHGDDGFDDDDED